MMASLGHLEIDVLASILEYVDDSHPESTQAIAIANKHIYGASTLVSHRRKTLNFKDPSEISETTTKWLQNPMALLGIRHIIISRPEEDIYALESNLGNDTDCWKPFVQFIEQAGRLETIIWKCDSHVPLLVINALEKHHPKLELKLYNYVRPNISANSQHPAELALASSPLLVGINAKIYSNHNFSRDFREIALRRIIAQAPNLKFASILVDEAERAGHRAADPEDRNPFYVNCSPNSAVRTLVLDGYQLSKATLVDWSDFVDLSTLENIKCLRGGLPMDDYFRYALKKLPNLKHLSLNLRFNQSKQFRGAVENYLALCPTLESISLWSWKGRVKLETILRHGPTLQMLQLHEREEGMLGHPSMPVEDVKAIRLACPHLTELTIDMRREKRNLTGYRNAKIIDELALFGPQLEKIQIYFDLGLASIWSGIFTQELGAEDSSSDEDDSESDDPEMDAFLDASEDDDSGAGAGAGPGNGNRRAAPQPVTFKIIKPSKARYIETFMKQTWSTVFGQKRLGPRVLDVKFGEWEQKVGLGGRRPGTMRSLEMGLKSFWTAKPCVRDDQRDQCDVERRGL